MKVTVSRSSVCMGDDMEDHGRTVMLDDGASCKDLVNMLRSSGFFASVSGNNVVWVLTADKLCIAAYYTKMRRVSLLREEKKLSELVKTGELHFNYYSSPFKWKTAIESYYMNADSSVKRGVWNKECNYCKILTEVFCRKG